MKKLALMLALMLAVISCAAMPVMAEAEEPIVLTVGKAMNTAGVVLPEGHNVEENNYWLQYIEETRNIKIEYEWLIADQEQKVSLALASGDMPDVMEVGYNDFMMLQESDMLADLTDAYNATIPGSILETSASLYPLSYEMACNSEGRLMAIPNHGTQYANGMLWIRQDWLTKLGLEMPKTIEDLEAVAKAFIEQDPDGNGEADTIGIAMTGTDFLKSDGYKGMANICSTLYGTFPKMWYRNDEGKIVYGSVEAGTRDMLEMLARWYKEGIIDPEFAVRDNNEQIVAGKCGISNGPWYASNGTMGQSWVYDQADWQPVLAPLNDAGEYWGRFNTPASEFIVVSKDCENLEAVFETYIASYEFHWSVGLNDEWMARRKEYSDLGTEWGVMPLAIVWNAGNPSADRNAAFVSYIDNGVYPEDASAEIKSYLDEYLTYEKDPTHLQGWAWYKGMYYAYGLNLEENYKRETPVFSGTTPTMSDMWTTLQTMEDETFLKIVLGTADIEEFDKFVAQWHALGGDDIIAEIEAMIG